MSRRVPVEDDLLQRVLAPYKDHCRYLERATVVSAMDPPATGAPPANGSLQRGRWGDGEPLVWIEGELAIPASCYIEDTGHFNSVEFNLCYNQLVYTLMAQCVVSELLPPFSAMTLEEYLARQLPDVLIHEFSSKFSRPMDMRAFRGRVTITSAGDRKRFLLVHTTCQFDDDRGGHSHGEVTLAIVQRSAAVPEPEA